MEGERSRSSGIMATLLVSDLRMYRLRLRSLFWLNVLDFPFLVLGDRLSSSLLCSELIIENGREGLSSKLSGSMLKPHALRIGNLSMHSPRIVLSKTLLSVIRINGLTTTMMGYRPVSSAPSAHIERWRARSAATTINVSPVAELHAVFLQAQPRSCEETGLYAFRKLREGDMRAHTNAARLIVWERTIFHTQWICRLHPDHDTSSNSPVKSRAERSMHYSNPRCIFIEKKMYY